MMSGLLSCESATASQGSLRRDGQHVDGTAGDDDDERALLLLSYVFTAHATPYYGPCTLARSTSTRREGRDPPSKKYNLVAWLSVKRKTRRPLSHFLKI